MADGDGRLIEIDDDCNACPYEHNGRCIHTHKPTHVTDAMANVVSVLSEPPDWCPLRDRYERAN